MGYVFHSFYIRCGTCGHINRPHKSPREGIRMALTGLMPPCRGCGKILRFRLSNRPLVRKVRNELLAQGIQPTAG